MKNNIENIPSEVFDWLSSLSFEQLNSQQKQVVLQYFTIEEYYELANSMHEINSIVKPAPINVLASKERLMNKFDEVYPKHQKRFIMPSVLRYAAIVIVSLGLGYQLRFWLQPTTANQVVYQPIVDTVYINNDIETASAVTLKENHSVTAEVTAGNGSQVKRKYGNTPLSKKKMNLNLNVVSVQDAKNKANIPKGNNCKSDSLRRKFVYVTL